GLEPAFHVRRQPRELRRGVADVFRAHRAIEALEDAVIDDALLAVVDLHLALGIVDVTDAEDVLHQKLLRTLAEVLELGGGDGLERAARACQDDRAGEIAIEGGAVASASEHLQRSSGAPGDLAGRAARK